MSEPDLDTMPAGSVDAGTVPIDPGTVPIVNANEPEPIPPTPPGRPRFEFRERPSAVLAERAGSVSVSAALWLVTAGLVLVAALLMLLDLHGLQAAVRAVTDRDFPAETVATRDRAAAVALAVLIGSAGLLGLVTAAVAARPLRAGRSGARFGLAVLLAGVAVLVLLSLEVVPLLVRVPLLLAVACGTVAAVLQWLPAANRWFASRP